MTENTYEIALSVDAQGLQCPLPLLKAKQALNKANAGDVIEVLATDVGSKRDIVAYVEMSQHKLLDFKEQTGVFSYLIEKA